MTDNCPVCDEELNEYSPLGGKICTSCGYNDGEGIFGKDENQLLYEIAEILMALTGEVKNINTDEELEEIEENIEKCRDCIRKILENKNNSQWDDKQIPEPTPLGKPLPRDNTGPIWMGTDISTTKKSTKQKIEEMSTGIDKISEILEDD